MKKWAILAASAVFLASCAEEAEPAEEETPVEEVTEEVPAEETEEVTEPEAEEEVAEEPAEPADATVYEEEGFISQVQSEGFLVNGILFSVGDGTEVVYEDGAEGTISEIAAGQKVVVSYEGEPTGQYPLEAEAGTVTILNNAEAQEQADAIAAFIESEELGDLSILGRPIVQDGMLGFIYTDMESGEIREVQIDLETHEYTIDGEAPAAAEATE
ncbi:hypothetical protein [Indiicoccus explosivorum]|uniref:hypothetical protein n=1 Tax=Indiicoccus explosivorum TaxID=1917864 RepID=UPI000B4392BD|nr:hypothetical protein [Indiicoccus explosivorum]